MTLPDFPTATWTHHDVRAFFVAEDTNGDPIGIADHLAFDPATEMAYSLFEYAFVESINVVITPDATRRPVLGRAAKKITVDDYEAQCQISGLHFRLNEINLTTIFNRQFRFRLFYDLSNPLKFPLETNIEQHVFLHCVGSGLNLQSADNASVVNSVTVISEEYYQNGY